MLYCGDTKLTVSENWDSSDAEKLGIIHVTEKRFYEHHLQQQKQPVKHLCLANIYGD